MSTRGLNNMLIYNNLFNNQIGNYNTIRNFIIPIKTILIKHHNHLKRIAFRLNSFEPLFLEFYTLKMNVSDLQSQIEKSETRTLNSFSDLKEQFETSETQTFKSISDLKEQIDNSDTHALKLSISDLKTQVETSETQTLNSISDLQAQINDIKQLENNDNREILLIKKIIFDEIQPAINELFNNLGNTDQDVDFLFEYFFHKSRDEVFNNV